MHYHGSATEGAPTQSAGAIVKKLWPYFRPHRTRLLVVSLIAVVATLVELAAPYLIGVAVDGFIDATKGATYPWLRLLLGHDPDRLRGLSTVMGLLAASYVLSWGLNVVQFRAMVRVAQSVLLHLRAQILAKLHGLSLDFYDRHEAGDLMSRLTNDTQTINDVFGVGITRVIRMVLGMAGIIAAMVALNWRLALASYTVLPMILLLTIFFTRRVRRAYREARRTIGEVSAELQENIAGVREVQAFAREDETISEFRAVNARNRAANVRAETLSALYSPALDVLSIVALAIVVGYGGYLYLRTPPLVTIGTIVTFSTYVPRFYDPIRELAMLFAQLQSAIAGSERIFDLLEQTPTVADRPDADVLEDVTGRVTYDRVSFRYVADEPVLDEVSAAIEPGQTIALVGPTGAGKTTFANLLLRFYDPQGGRILIDGRDIREVTQASLRAHMGVVPQDTFLFSGTVMENIRYGRLEATDEEVIAAAKTANAHSFIERLPQSYETEVGERGATLSQGNRQLLAIARAVLKAPPILILDEATSSVDTRTERLIQAALDRLMSCCTSIVIAHRLSTIRNADQILVIDEGRIVERGRHDELLAAGGAYSELYMSQFRRQLDIEAQLTSTGPATRAGAETGAPAPGEL